jgi:signal transduction histidine kinase
MMPNMDGYEVCRRLRADAELAEVPIILVTALDDRESRLEGLRAGADDFVSKPYDRLELRARIRTITRLNRYRGLLRERGKFKWVVEQSEEGYLILDADGGIAYANRQARAYLGLPAGDETLAGAGFVGAAERLYRREPPASWASWLEAPPGGAPLFLVRPESAGVRALWLQVDVLWLPDGPSPQRLVRLRDVTERKSLQHDMWKFHSAMSHKLRTPLTGLLCGLTMLQTDVPGMSEEIKEVVELTLAGARRLQEEIEDVLRYTNTRSLAGAGRGFAVAELPSLVERVGAELGLASLRVREHEDVRDARLSIAERTLELVLEELVENAIKFHPANSPSVDVIVRGAADGRVVVQVVDDGRAIEPELLARVWGPYYQAERHHTGETAGMGLGLSTVAALVCEVGGECRIFNREGAPGAVVELMLLRDSARDAGALDETASGVTSA